MKERNKILLIVGIAIAALLLIVVVAGIHLESKAGQIIETEFAKLTHGRYKLTVGKTDVNLFNRSVTIRDIDIISTGTEPVESQTDNILPKFLVELNAKELFIAGIRFNNKDGGIKLGIRRLKLSSPKIYYTQLEESEQQQKDSVSRGKPISVNINRIIISEGYLEHRNLSHNDTTRNIIEGLKFETGRFFINNNADYKFPVWGSDIKLSATKISHLPADQATRFELDSLYIETIPGILRFSSFSVIPTYPKEEFAVKSWRHEDWTKMAVNDVHCWGVDYGTFEKEGIIVIDSATLGNGSVSSYKNRNVRRTEWVKPLFQQRIQRLPVKINIRKLSFSDFDAQYEERSPGAAEAGIITISDAKGNIENFTNITPAGEPYIKMSTTALVNNAGRLNSTLYLPVDSLTNRFELITIIGAMEMKSLNSMIVPLANIEIRDGTMDKMDFHLVGNTHKASVDLTFLYHDLKVSLLKEERKKGKEGKETKERKFLSEIVNNMVIIQENPYSGGEVRTSRGSVERDPYRSPFNYLWRTVMDGVKETVGI